MEDFKALLAPFIAANAADNITVVMNPTQGLSLAMMPGPAGQPNWFSEIRSACDRQSTVPRRAG